MPQASNVYELSILVTCAMVLLSIQVCLLVLLLSVYTSVQMSFTKDITRLCTDVASIV